MPESYCVVLVHGTFAVDTPWVKEGSRLRKAIADALPGTVEFIEFQWSGNNKHSDRVTAGRELELLLRERLAAAPASKHFLICHSHGGNVGLLALRDPQIQQRVAGVICLNTPFVHAFRRSLATTVFLPAALILLAALGMFYPAVLAATDDFQFSQLAVVACGLLLVGLAAVLRRVVRVEKVRDEQLRSLVNQVSLPRITATKVACLTTASDEVFDLFSATTAINSFILQFLRPKPIFAAVLLVSAATALGWLPQFPGTESLPLLGAKLTQLKSGTGASQSPISVFFVWLVSTTLYLVSMILAVHLFAWARLRAFGIDGVGLLVAPHVAIASTPVPLTAEHCSFEQFDAFQLNVHHSASHGDAQVLDAIVRKIVGDHEVRYR